LTVVRVGVSAEAVALLSWLCVAWGSLRVRGRDMAFEGCSSSWKCGRDADPLIFLFYFFFIFRRVVFTGWRAGLVRGGGLVARRGGLWVPVVGSARGGRVVVI